MNGTIRDSLDAGSIRAAMAPAFAAKLGQLTVLPETDSTNSAVLRLPGDRQHAHAVLAERQTRGRGRRERSWHSPAGGNIYLSLGWWFRDNRWPLSTLPLLTAVAACRALSRAGLSGHGIKWPNDVLVDGRKLAGILAELQSAGDGPALAVIGIGLNVRMPSEGGAEPGEGIDRPWTDLASEIGPGGAAPGRNRMAALLLDALLEALERFEQSGFAPFENEWQKLDLLQDRTIRLEQDGEIIAGVARGIDTTGGLLLERPGAGLRTFHSGEVSIPSD